MSKKLWIKNYEADVPHEIDADSPSSVWSLATDAIAKFGDAPAFSNFGTDLSYR